MVSPLLEAHPLFELYGSLEKDAGIGIWKFNFSNHRLIWSAGVYDLIGLERWIEPPSQDLFGQFVHPDDRVPVDNLGDYLNKVRSISRQFRIIQPNGRIKWVSHVAEVFTNGADKATMAVGILIDITPLKEAVTERDFAENQLRAFKKTAQAFSWTIRTDRFEPSQGWMDLTGQSAQQSSDLGWLSVVHEEDRERIRNAWINAVSTRTKFSAKYRVLAKDGRYRWFVARCEPIADESGNLIEWFGVGVDISDAKQPTSPFFTSWEIKQFDGSIFRAARAMLDWSVQTFARRSGLSQSSIRRLESAKTDSARGLTVVAALHCLEAHGIEVCQFDDHGCFIRLKQGPGNTRSQESLSRTEFQ
jgi:PAS domain S-box-containing protein